MSGASPCSWSPAEPEQLSQVLTELMYSRTWEGTGGAPSLEGALRGFAGHEDGAQVTRVQPPDLQPSLCRPLSPVRSEQEELPPTGPPALLIHFRPVTVEKEMSWGLVELVNHCRAPSSATPTLHWIRRVLGLHQLSSAGMVQP